MPIALLALLVLVPVPQAPQVPAPLPVAPPQPGSTYLVGPGDVLSIRVFDEPGLTGEFNVDGDGTITYPFLRRVEVKDKNLREIEELLTKRLVDGYVNRPQVSVEISDYRSRSIYVLGEVRNPGKYSIKGTVTLLEVIANAGSLTPTAGDSIIVQRYKDGIPVVSEPALPGDDRAAEVMRVSMNEIREGRISANLLLQDGDTIFVPQAPKFYVTGFVKSPGAYVLTPGMTVQQAIAVAGGLAERGSTRGIKIIRKVNGKDVEVGVNMSDLVQPNDTIRVRQRLI